MGKNINLPRFPEKNGPELSCGRNLPCGKVNADAGSVAKRGIELNNESGGPRRCISRPPPLKTLLYHASPHRPTFARIGNSYAVCRRLPTHHQLKYQPILRLVFFCLLPRVHGGWRGFLRTSPKVLAAVFGTVFSLRWPVLSVPAPTKIGQVLKRKI